MFLLSTANIILYNNYQLVAHTYVRVCVLKVVRGEYVTDLRVRTRFPTSLIDIEPRNIP